MNTVELIRVLTRIVRENENTPLDIKLVYIDKTDTQNHKLYDAPLELRNIGILKSMSSAKQSIGIEVDVSELIKS